MMALLRNHMLFVLVPAVLITVLMPLAARAQSIEKFYAGKQIVINVGSSAGGGYDGLARLMARHIGKFIPGKPSAIVQNMPAAGGLVAANHFYNVAAKDGSVIALLQRTAIIAKPLIVENVNFDVKKLQWIGSLASEPGVLVAWHTSQVATAQDLLTKELIVGGNGVANDTELTPKVINAVLGTKLKVISGYPGMTEVSLSMERGEVAGITDWSWSNVKRSPRYLQDKLVRVLMQFGIERSADLPDVPIAQDLAKNPSDKSLLSLYFAPKAVARPVAYPPGVPGERVEAMRTAFMQMAKDPEVLAEAEKSGIPLDPSDHRSIEKVVDLVESASPEVIERLRGIIASK